MSEQPHRDPTIPPVSAGPAYAAPPAPPPQQPYPPPYQQQFPAPPPQQPYPPGPHAQPPHAFPPPSRPAQPKANWLVVGIVVGAVLLLVGIGVIGSLLDDKQAENAAEKISTSVTSCKLAAGVATVDFTVTNNGSKTADSVAVDIEYRDDSGARVDTDTAYVRDVRPGETVRGQEVTALDVAVTSGKCGIVRVVVR